tara:strand:+ start:363 stop:698 length:336 start_codon:yes stop_codon:yes gene_type:complete
MNFKFEIKNLKRDKSTGMVHSVNYYYGAEHSGSSHSGGKTYIAQNQYIHTLTTGSVSDADFIQYEDLNEGIVLSWITGSLDTGLLQRELSSSIAIKEASKMLSTNIEGKPW